MPTGTGVGSKGGSATQTPTAKTSDIWVALLAVDGHEPARVGQSLDPLAVVVPEAIDAAESREHHRELRSGALCALLDRAVLIELRRLNRVGLTLSTLALVTHLMSRSRMIIRAFPSCRRRRQGPMADIGLGSDESDRHAISDFALAEIRDGGQRIFIGRTEAGRALHRPNHHRPGVLAELLPAVSGKSCVIDMTDGFRVAIGPQALNLVESEMRSRGDHEIIVIERRSVIELNGVLVWLHALRADRSEANCAS